MTGLLPLRVQATHHEVTPHGHVNVVVLRDPCQDLYVYSSFIEEQCEYTIGDTWWFPATLSPGERAQ